MADPLVDGPVRGLARLAAVGDVCADVLACHAVPAQLLWKGRLAVGALGCDDITLDAVNGGGHADQFLEIDACLKRWIPLYGAGVSFDAHGRVPGCVAVLNAHGCVVDRAAVWSLHEWPREVGGAHLGHGELQAAVLEDLVDELLLFVRGPVVEVDGDDHEVAAG